VTDWLGKEEGNGVREREDGMTWRVQARWKEGRKEGRKAARKEQLAEWAGVTMVFGVPEKVRGQGGTA